MCVSSFTAFPHLPNCSISLAINASEEPGFSRSMFTKALETLCPTDPFEVSPPTAYTSFASSGKLANVRRLEIDIIYKEFTSFRDGKSNSDNDADNDANSDSSSSSLTCCDLMSGFCLSESSRELLQRNNFRSEIKPVISWKLSVYFTQKLTSNDDQKYLLLVPFFC